MRRAQLSMFTFAAIAALSGAKEAGSEFMLPGEWLTSLVEENLQHEKDLSALDFISDNFSDAF